MKRDMKAHKRRAGSVAADGFVLLAMAVVAAAIGAGINLHLGASKGIGIGFALATYLLLYKLHQLRSASQKAARLDAQVRRLETELDKSKGNAGEAAQPHPESIARQPGAAAVAPPAAPAVSAQKAHSAAPVVPAVQPPVAPAAASAARRNEGAPQSNLSALKDFWAYRPSDPAPGPLPRLPQAPQPLGAPPAVDEVPVRPSVPRAPATQRPLDEPPAAALREADVEMIQGLIKRLADEVNAADASMAAGRSGPPASDESIAAPQAQLPAGPPMASTRPAEAVEASLDALRMTADTMRESASRTGGAKLSELRLPRHEPEPMFAATPSAPPPVRPGHYKLAAIADAVHAGRFEVLLEPVMGLADLRARHYEVSIRLFDPAGGAIEALSADPALAGTNLLPLLDRTRFDRAASVARRLSERGKTGSVFSEYSGEALTDGAFLEGAAQDPVGQLVLTFAQADVRNLSGAQWKGLAELKALGFRFALSEVTDLDMDFERLAAAGFDFVKLDAAVFLEGLKGPHGTVPSCDICGYLARMGFTLVANRIDSEYERSRLFGFGVLFGQGQLFGGARPMKADALAGAKHAAA
jgi:cyclic-di-GMP phosphodiesterase TipF (flagellum assembly factor)